MYRKTHEMQQKLFFWEFIYLKFVLEKRKD